MKIFKLCYLIAVFVFLRNSLLAMKEENVAIGEKQVETNLDKTKSHKFFYGTASYYSKSLEGTKTSNDETFSHKKLTCASNRFKIGTWLRVTNLSNDKSVIVRVNDRMHPKMDKKGRIVDLSYEGARKLSFLKKGITKVKVEIVTKDTTE